MVTTDLDHVTPFTEALIRTASHPILSEHLPQALTGEADLERALRKLRAWNPGLLTVTVGERGAVALDGDRFVQVNGFPRVRPWTPPAPATCSAARSSPGCCRGFPPRTCSASPTPPRR